MTAIHHLLPNLELEGCVVSINTLACQIDIAETVADRGDANGILDELNPDRRWAMPRATWPSGASH